MFIEKANRKEKSHELYNQTSQDREIINEADGGKGKLRGKEKHIQ